jgi:hypothetical protein
MIKQSTSDENPHRSCAMPPADPPVTLENHAYASQSTSDHNSVSEGERDPFLAGATNSYQHSRAAALPAIRHYQEEDDDPRSFFVVRGDATLRPNTGLTNRYDTALFGLALHELLEHIRLANLISSSSSVLLLLVSWFWRLLTGQIARLVLSCYLGFLAALLFLVEVIGLWGLSSVDSFLKNNFGLLRHPVGRCIYIFLLSTLCFAIGGWWYWAVGVLYVLTSIVLLYAWTVYPELRRPFEAEDANDPLSDANASASPGLRSSVTWSSYSSTVSSFVKAGSETAALLSVGRLEGRRR